VIIGTAGHIDHGKSALVEKLTGQPMDRLREERERGITIDLNFAPLEIEPGVVAGVVDVPGHEDFVRTMVAGASGIDLILLVIAADEGIKPQTREHLAIAEQLGIARGIPVITKADLVDAEWADLVTVEVSEWLARSPISFAPPRLVSALSGVGIADLRSDIRRLTMDLPQRKADDLFRLPVDRSFSVAGIGTVVTGTAWTGSIAPGDHVLIMPARKAGRVRTVQTHGREAARSEPGSRVALGLAGLERSDIRRGDTVVLTGAPWETTLALDVMIELMPDAPRPLITRSRTRLHLGTSEILARVYPRGRIEPGQAGMARLALESPAMARGGDRLVLRGYSPVVTIGGGRVLDPVPPRRRASWSPELQSEEVSVRAIALVARRPSGLEENEAAIVLGVPPSESTQVLSRLGNLCRAGNHWVTRDLINTLADSTRAVLETFHRTRPSDPGMPLGELRQGLRSAPWIVDAIVGEMERSGTIVVAEGIVRRAGFTPRVAMADGQVNRVVNYIQRAGLAPPSTAELAAALGIGDLGATLRLAARDRLLEPVERDRHYAMEPLGRFVATLVELGKLGSITPAALRDRLGISRKFLIPLLEWADAKGITVRAGEGRTLRKGYQLPGSMPVP
jgi:selenocysteine-specific elongation factor